MLESKNKTRLVVFIDDLDRLNPEIAVEVLEVLKIFLDVKNCVYILAVDYEVVTQGIKKKFGENVGAAKGKSFFDKMIQLPFKVPVQLYELNEFLKCQLSCYKITDPKVISVFEELIKGSIGSNPRTMKRLFNSFHLIRNVMNYEEKEELDEYENELLFAVLCLQMAFEPLYEYFMETNEWTDPSSNNIFTQDSEGIKNKISVYDKDIDIKYAKSTYKFIKILSKVISYGIIRKIPEEVELEHFGKILSYSSITTTSSTSDTSSTDIPLNDNLNLSLYTITGVRYKEEKCAVKGFTAAFVWILEQIGKESKYNQRFQEIAANPKDSKISDRFFNKVEKVEQIPKSSIKLIKSLNLKVVTHYSSKELKAILLKLLVALDISKDYVTLLGFEK